MIDGNTEWRWAPRVYVENARSVEPAYHIPLEAVREALEPVCQLKELTCRFSDERDLTAWRRADVLLAVRLETAPIEHEADKLKLIQCIGAGVENYAPFEWLRPGITLTNSRGVHAAKIGEFALMAALMLHQRAPAIATNQRGHLWHRDLRDLAAGHRVLIYGVGALGGAVADRLGAAGFTLTGIRRSAAPHPAIDHMCTPDQLLIELARTDIVILACPLTADTRDLMGEQQFAALPAGAGLLNIARAGVIDQGALVASLRSGHLSGAILDVFEQEPLPAASELWDVPNLMIYPHVSAAAPHGYIGRCLAILSDNLVRAQSNLPLRNIVNTLAGY
ncbi:phosphoglycerate dehydrogenase-like enzyme [Novosphingobium sp. SG751A]|uniref:D-2-hydroxyacid dehydrogenase n=1 Tax=Novosphingobium sp. SG751A TaxID=2587000 RepID=UPI001557B2AD|nr:D-2-hydroxyacid dehydrogenase [Novosphingobium sp. SG751A]NOW44977.1 phosphoglycerate dehydrogenase-like enzyme [Novosphingobium sp. SG751A]